MKNDVKDFYFQAPRVTIAFFEGNLHLTPQNDGHEIDWSITAQILLVTINITKHVDVIFDGP